MQENNDPIIGKYWQGHGGVYAGIIRDGDRQWHLILAETTPTSVHATWGEYDVTIEGEFSRVDGHHNTQLILASDGTNKAANFATSLVIDGHSDFYWPAQFENNLICINLPDRITREWHWSSTQYSARGAWITLFEDGNQFIDDKYYSYAVRAVRRELII